MPCRPHCEEIVNIKGICSFTTVVVDVCCSIKQMWFDIDGIHILRFGLCIFKIIEQQNQTADIY